MKLDLHVHGGPHIHAHAALLGAEADAREAQYVVAHLEIEAEAAAFIGQRLQVEAADGDEDTPPAPPRALSVTRPSILPCSCASTPPAESRKAAKHAARSDQIRVRPSVPGFPTILDPFKVTSSHPEFR